MTTSYLINGKPAQGEDFIRAIDALSADDLDFVSVTIPEKKGEVIVFRASHGFWVNEERLDGSTWASPTLQPDRVRELVRAFLEDRANWRDGLVWELTSLTRRDARRRLLRIALIGFVVIALALWVTKLFGN